MKPASAKIKIADTVFNFVSQDKEQVRSVKRYKVFLSDERADIKVFIRIKKTWRNNPRHSILEVPSLNAREFSVKTRLFNAEIDFGKKTAHIEAGPNVGILNILKFLSAIFLLRREGFLLHASSVIRGGRAYTFFGPSGSGKTTVARLSEGPLLSDETTAIALSGKKFRAYATPFAGDFYGVKKNLSAPVKAIFLLRKDREFAHKKMSRKDAVKYLFESVMVPVHGHDFTESLFTVFERFLSDVPCYELYLRPEPELWRYVDEHFG
ncbi:MAG TPA: hypothetical protein PLV52_00600 [Candidatus Omnitrophota bacterium]|nr:hypothetical protein [Candidatus Omnitrophota bacterium]